MKKLLSLILLVSATIYSVSAAVVGSGNCGPIGDEAAVQWSYDDATRVLNITGTGDMAGYNKYLSKAPWLAAYGSSIQTVQIGEGVTSIGNYAFYGCTQLQTLITSSSTKTIGNNAFDGCTSLSSISLVDGIQSIGSSAFGGCQNLTIVALPSTLTNLGSQAFTSCLALTDITIKSGLEIGDRVFEDCNSLTTINTQVRCLHTTSVNAFTGLNTSAVTVKVTDCDYVQSYLNDEQWKVFAIQGNVLYTITADVNSSTYGSILNAGAYYCGQRITLTAVPNTGYEFVQWVENGSTNADLELLVDDDATYTAEFKAIEYDVTFKASGVEIYSTKVAYNETLLSSDITAAEDAAKLTIIDPCGEFTGWDNDVTLPILGSIEFNAQFGTKQYAITLDVNDAAYGTVTGAGTYDCGTAQTIEANANACYEFEIWSDGSTDNPRSVSVDADITLTAQFKVKTYNVTFFTEGGVQVGAAVEIDCGKSLDAGMLLVKQSELTPIDCKMFDSWSFFPYDPTATPVTDDITAMANFTTIKYTISVATEDPSKGSAAGGGIDLDCGSNTTLTATSLVGYEFDKWDDGNTDNPRTVTVESDKTYTASFKIKTYTVTFSYDGNVYDTQVVEHGSDADGTIAESKLPTVDCMSFDKWLGTTTNIDSNRDIVAQYKTTSITVHFTVDGSDYATKDVDCGDYAIAPSVDPEKTNYDFKGWLPVPSETVIKTETTFEAQFALKHYTITVQDGCAVNPNAPMTLTDIEYGTDVEPLLTAWDHTADGYEFDAWSPSTIVSGDMTITANYTLLTLTLTFHYPDGTTETKTVKYGETLSTSQLPVDPIQTGKVFKQWDKDLVNIKTDLDLYPEWDDATYTVSFYQPQSDLYPLLKGTLISTETVTYNDYVTPPTAFAVPTGKALAGWVCISPVGGSVTEAVTGNMEFIAQYETAKYIVRFLDHDDSVLSSQEVTYGDGATAPADPIRTGYTFSGWSPANFSVIDKDTDIKAQYTIITLTATFYRYNLDGDFEVLTTRSFNYGEDVPSVPALPVYPGHTPTGWDKALTSVTENIDVYPLYTVDIYTVSFYNVVDGINVWLKDEPVEYGKTVDMTPPATPQHECDDFIGWSPDVTATPVTGDVSTYAQYLPKTYTVTFYGLGGTPQIGTPQLVTCGDDATEPIAPSVDGYDFTGWDKSTTNVHEDLDITATYEKHKYTVVFNDWDGTELITRQVEFGALATEPELTPSRPGYTFAGWDYDVTKAIEKDMTFTAQYDINMFEIAFVDYDGTPISNQTVAWHTNATTPADPTRVGHTFTGWDSNAYLNVEADATITAQYEINKYVVTFTKDFGGVETPLGTEVVEYGTIVATPTYPSLDEDGYVYEWTPDISLPIENHTAFRTVYTQVFKVRFIDWDDTLIEEQVVEYGKDATAPTVNDREGYDFTGWSESYANVTSNLTIKATYNVWTYTVTFVNYDGSVLKVQPDVPYNTAATPPTTIPSKGENFIFVGWDVDYSHITSDLIVVAKFVGKYYTVLFVDWDGHTIYPSIVEYGEAAIAPENPVRPGYTFDGWDKDFTYITNDMVVTATYHINAYTVTFVDINGTTLSTQTIEYGKSATAPQAPQIEGKTFVEWDTDYSSITVDVTIHPIYSDNEYTVTFVDWNTQVLSTTTVKHGESATAPSDPVRTGYTFTGWDQSYTNITSDLTITATYQQQFFTVTFMGPQGVITTETVVYGGRPAEPTAPIVTGQEFAGWDTKFDYVTTDLTVTAIYTTTLLTVYFRDYDERLIDMQQVPYGSSASAPANPYRDGYEFDGWDTDFSNITTGLTVHPIYHKSTCQVVFRDWDGSFLDRVDVAYGTTPTTIPQPDNKEGYHFVDWDKDITVIHEDIEVWAQYEINYYTLTVLANDYVVGMVNGSGTYSHGEVVTISAVAYDTDYEFRYWNTGDTVATLDVTITSDTTFTAYFRLVPFSVTVLEDALLCPGDTLVLPSGNVFVAEQTVQLFDTVRFEYEEDVWCDSIYDYYIEVFTRPVLPLTIELPKVVYSRPIDLASATTTIESAISSSATPTTATVEESWWELLIDEEWGEYTGDTIWTNDTISLRYVALTSCGDTLYTADLTAPILKPNADNCADCQESVAAVIVYDWMFMIDKASLNHKGYVFGEENVVWYRVVGSLDDMDADEADRDDEEVGTGYYYLSNESFAGKGVYYAIIYLPEQTGNVPCLGNIRSSLLEVTATPAPVSAVRLAPSLVAPAQQVRISGLPVAEAVTITIYSASGELVATFQTAGEEEFVFLNEMGEGTYLVNIQSETVKSVVKYVVKQ